MQMEALPKQPASPNSRIASIAFVAGLHVVAIYGLLAALNPALIFVPPHRTDITVLPPKPLQPPQSPTVDTRLIVPSGPVVTRPVIEIDRSVTPMAAKPDGEKTGGVTATTAPSPTSGFLPPRAIADTHTTPGYPPLAARLGEFGSVQLALRIDENGTVTDATVIQSSGHDLLDATAITWVKAHWKYQPASRDGIAVAATARAIVTFSLTAARD